MPDIITTDPTNPTRPKLLQMMRRGAIGCCPICGGGKLFSSWLKVAPDCTACHAPTGNCRADDAPPYFVLLITGHVLVPGLVWVEENTAWSVLTVSSIFLPLTAIMVLGLLQPVKGAIIGWMMHLNMHAQPSFRPNANLAATVPIVPPDAPMA